VAVLAGGEGTRMGGPKAAVELDGIPLLEWALHTAEAAGLDAIVVAKPDATLPETDARIVHENSRIRHPLAGIVAALEAGGGRPVIVLACDTPFVPASILQRLAGSDERLIVVSTRGRLHPLIARYEPSLLVALKRGLELGVSMNDMIRGLRPTLIADRELESFGDPLRITLNVNTPADLERAEELLGGDIGTGRDGGAATAR